jgi:competence ComEA-like helix-hairpin-helix protein
MAVAPAMSLKLPLAKIATPRDWRGLLLVLSAVFMGLVGPVGTQPPRVTGALPAGGWDSLVARSTAGSDCGVDPRQAVFLLQPIDLNRADAEVLASLKGIGPGLAARIIAYRALRGGFKKVADLDEVAGIGPRKMAGLVNAVAVYQPGFAEEVSCRQ